MYNSVWLSFDLCFGVMTIHPESGTWTHLHSSFSSDDLRIENEISLYILPVSLYQSDITLHYHHHYSSIFYSQHLDPLQETCKTQIMLNPRLLISWNPQLFRCKGSKLFTSVCADLKNSTVEDFSSKAYSLDYAHTSICNKGSEQQSSKSPNDTTCAKDSVTLPEPNHGLAPPHSVSQQQDLSSPNDVKLLQWAILGVVLTLKLHVHGRLQIY